MTTKRLYHFNNNFNDSGEDNVPLVPANANHDFLTGKFSQGATFVNGGSSNATAISPFDGVFQLSTIEFFAKFDPAGGQQQGIFRVRDSSINVDFLYVEHYRPAPGLYQLIFFYNSASLIINATTITNDGNFHHIAMVRESATLIKIYIDGVYIGSPLNISGAFTVPSGMQMLVGSVNQGLFGNLTFSGVIDELRISDTAVYTTDFTPTTVEFTTGGQPVAVLSKITIGNKRAYEVDAIPSSGLGLNAPLGSLAFYDDGTVGQVYVKSGASDTSWSLLSSSGDVSGLQAQIDAIEADLIANYATLALLGAPNGIAQLGPDGKILNSQLSALAITDTFVVNSQASMLALASAEQGDVAVRTDINKSFILVSGSPSVLANWQELLSPTDAVQSVNGQSGVVILTTTDISEGTNLYFTEGRVRATPLTGFSDATQTPILATDSVLSAFGKAQGQINKEIADRIADVDAEEARAILAEQALDLKIDQQFGVLSIVEATPSPIQLTADIRKIRIGTSVVTPKVIRLPAVTGLDVGAFYQVSNQNETVICTLEAFDASSIGTLNPGQERRTVLLSNASEGASSWASFGTVYTRTNAFAINVQNLKIVNHPLPTNPNDVANKAYVDAQIASSSSIDWKYASLTSELNVSTATSLFGNQSDFNIEFYRNSVKQMAFLSGSVEFFRNISMSGSNKIVHSGDLYLEASFGINMVAVGSVSITTDQALAEVINGVTSRKRAVSSSIPSANDTHTVNILADVQGQPRLTNFRIIVKGQNGANEISAVFTKDVHMSAGNVLVLVQDSFTSKNSEALSLGLECTITYSAGNYVVSLSGLGTSSINKEVRVIREEMIA